MCAGVGSPFAIATIGRHDAEHVDGRVEEHHGLAREPGSPGDACSIIRSKSSCDEAGAAERSGKTAGETTPRRKMQAQQTAYGGVSPAGALAEDVADELRDDRHDAEAGPEDVPVRREGAPQRERAEEPRRTTKKRVDRSERSRGIAAYPSRASTADGAEGPRPPSTRGCAKRTSAGTPTTSLASRSGPLCSECVRNAPPSMQRDRYSRPSPSRRVPALGTPARQTTRMST